MDALFLRGTAARFLRAVCLKNKSLHLVVQAVGTAYAKQAFNSRLPAFLSYFVLSLNTAGLGMGFLSVLLAIRSSFCCTSLFLFFTCCLFAMVFSLHLMFVLLPRGTRRTFWRAL